MKKSFKKLVLAISVFTFLSCTSQRNHDWTVYNPKETGLKSHSEQFRKLIVGKDRLYLFGLESNFFDISKDKALVYMLKENENKWKQLFTGKGEITNGYMSNNRLFYFKKNYTDNSLGNGFLMLNNLCIESKQTEIIHKFNKNSSVKDVFVNVNGKGALILSNSFSSIDHSVFKTINNFNTYDSISIDKAVKSSFVLDDKVYLLTYRTFSVEYEEFETNKLHILNADNTLDSLDIDFNVSDFLVEENETLWFLGKDNDSILVRKRDGNIESILNTVSVGEEETPQKLYKYNNFVAVLTNVVDTGMLGGFGGTKYKLYLSFDNGKTFKQEKLPIDDYVEPIEFYKDEKIVIYSGAGRISMCNLKK